jgi:hypothetical protein
MRLLFLPIHKQMGVQDRKDMNYNEKLVVFARVLKVAGLVIQV